MTTKELFERTSFEIGNLDESNIGRLSPSALLNLGALQGILITLTEIRSQNNAIIHLLNGGKLEEPQVNEAQAMEEGLKIVQEELAKEPATP